MTPSRHHLEYSHARAAVQTRDPGPTSCERHLGTLVGYPTHTFGAAAAQRTTRIGLGTAVVVPTERPIRVAEDALVVDALSHERLHLGVGTGGDPTTFAAFGRDMAARHELFGAAVDNMTDALSERPINGGPADTIGQVGTHLICQERPGALGRNKLIRALELIARDLVAQLTGTALDTPRAKVITA